MGAAESILTFDAESHAYWCRGVKVPGVTTILKPLIDFSHIDPDVLAAKADLGTRVHEACHFLDEDDLDEETIEADVEPYLEAWKRFKRETGAVVLLSEQRVHETLLGFAGTLDNVLLIDGKKWLADKKTALQVPASAGPQTAAYQRALGDATVQHRAVVRLHPDGTYHFDPLTGADDFAVFMACLAIHRFKEKHQ